MDEEARDDLGELVKTIAWQDPDGNVLALSASPHGLSVAVLEPGEAGTGVTLKPTTIPQFTAFLFECAAQFGALWRAQSDHHSPTT